MSTPLLRTKLYVPPSRLEVVKRTRLEQRLNEAVNCKLTLISAPAGFGKTTLVSSWLKDENISVAWLSIDQDDNDPIRFWYYFINAIQTIEENIGRDFLAILKSAQSPPFEALISELINEIDESQARIIFILDDYHLIANQQVQDTLYFLLEHLPFRMHLIIMSRIDPPWPLACLRAGREIAELRVENLRFSLVETAVFLKDIMGLDISPEDVAVLEQRTEGWIVGLQMAALSMVNRADISRIVCAFAGTHRYILDYLLEEVLEQQSPSTQMFLLETSILDRMTAPLCDAIIGAAGSLETLIRLERTNLFLIPLDDNREWYRYHHLFSELLRNQLSITKPKIIPTLHYRASRWYEDQDFSGEAIGHAFKAGDYSRVADLVEKYAREMLHQSNYKALFSWIEMIPEKLVQSRPWLCIYQAWTRHWTGMREGREDCLFLAEKLLDKKDFETESTTNLQGYIATVGAHYALINEDLPHVIEQAGKALIYLQDDHFARGTAAIALGGPYWGMGDVDRVEAVFAECASSALKGGYRFRASSALCYVGMQQVKQARLFDAEFTFLDALVLAQDPDRRQLPASGYPLAKLGELACEWNKLKDGYKNVTDGVKLCIQLGQVDLMAEAYVALARVQLAQKDFSEKEVTVQKIEQLTEETKLDPWAVNWLDECRLRMWLNTDRLDDAINWIESSGLGLDQSFNYQHDLNHLNLARVLVA